jgi:hypothetical protein
LCGPAPCYGPAPQWQQGGLFARDIFPALLSHFDEAGWNVLGYHYAPGRHADYSPGSHDLDRLVRLMNAINVPDDPGPFSELKTAGSSTFITWKRPQSSPGRSWPIRTGPRQRADIGAPRLADRLAWPTLGAAWTDPACWGLRALMASGGDQARYTKHSPVPGRL